MDAPDRLTPREAYQAMFKFLESYWESTKADDIGGLLGSLTLAKDGRPMDTAMWDEWLDAVRFAQRESRAP